MPEFKKISELIPGTIIKYDEKECCYLGPSKHYNGTYYLVGFKTGEIGWSIYNDDVANVDKEFLRSQKEYEYAYRVSDSIFEVVGLPAATPLSQETKVSQEEKLCLPSELKIGDKVELFLYKNGNNELIADTDERYSNNNGNVIVGTVVEASPRLIFGFEERSNKTWELKNNKFPNLKGGWHFYGTKTKFKVLGNVMEEKPKEEKLKEEKPKEEKPIEKSNMFRASELRLGDKVWIKVTNALSSGKYKLQEFDDEKVPRVVGGLEQFAEGVVISEGKEPLIGFTNGNNAQWAITPGELSEEEIKDFKEIKKVKSDITHAWALYTNETKFEVIGSVFDNSVKQNIENKEEVHNMKELSQFPVGSLVRVFLDEEGFVVDYETENSVQAKVLAQASAKEVILGFFGKAPIKTSSAAKWNRLGAFGLSPNGYSHIGGFKADRQHYSWDEPFSFDDGDDDYEDEEYEDDYEEEQKFAKKETDKKMKAKVATAPVHKTSLFDMIKEDSKEAMWRTAANQMTTATKAGIVMLLESKGQSNETIASIKEMLDTEAGAAVVSMLLGLGLTYVPQLSEDPRAKKLAKEFRTNGIATGMNAVMGVAMETIVPALSSALNSLPKEEPKLEGGDSH